MDQISRIGMDTSKHIFQLHGVNAAEEPVLRKKLRRKEMVTFFEKLAADGDRRSKPAVRCITGRGCCNRSAIR